jgi:hypothetical protein
MARISTREQFAELCLQKLGKPLIPIQVSPEQLEICVDDALKFYTDYHDDATIRTFIRRQVGANLVTITTPVAKTFQIGEKVIGATSNIEFTIFDIPSTTSICAEEYVQDLTIGETITGQNSGITAVVADSAAQNDINNGYITIPDQIISLNRILSFSGKTTNLSMFDIRYQLRLNDLYSMADSTLVYYTQVKQQLELMDQLLIGNKGIRFNRMMNRCYIDMDWHTDVENGDWLVFEGYATVNPDMFPDAYNDRVFQEICTNYIKRQWGQNLSLYGEISLPGGIKLNSDKILMDAEQKIFVYEKEFQDKYSAPPIFIMG